MLPVLHTCCPHYSWGICVLPVLHTCCLPAHRCSLFGELTLHSMCTAPHMYCLQVRRRFSEFAALKSALKSAKLGPLPPSWSDVSRARHMTGRARLEQDVVQVGRSGGEGVCRRVGGWVRRGVCVGADVSVWGLGRPGVGVGVHSYL